MKRTIYILLLLFSAKAAAEIDVNKLGSLFKSGDSRELYEYTLQYIATYEGDPTFDYYYGTAAIDVGHASEGVFALERVLLVQPDNHAARLELARGYYILEEYARSRKEFETVLKADPPEDVAVKIQKYIDSIRLLEGRYRTSATAFVEIGYGHDSNANSGPDDPFFSSNLGQQELDPTSLAQPDNFAELLASYNLRSPYSAGNSFYASVDANLRKYNEENEFDTALLTARGGLEFLRGNNTYSGGLIAQRFNLSGSEYRNILGAEFDWRNRPTQLTSISTTLQYLKQDYPGQDVRNTDTVSLSLGFLSRFSQKYSSVLFGSAYIGYDSPESDSDAAKQNTERTYYGARLGTILNTSRNTSLQGSLFYQGSGYGEENVLFSETRDDDYFNAALDFTWLLTRSWSVKAYYSYTINNSNIEIFEYDRDQVGVSLRYDLR